MRRSLKAALLAGTVVATLGGSAVPAQAATCVGFIINQGLQVAGVWNCSPCPEFTYGPLDGRFQVVVCIN